MRIASLAAGLGLLALPAPVPAQSSAPQAPPAEPAEPAEPAAPARSPRELAALFPSKTLLMVDLFDAPAILANARRLWSPLPGDLPAPTRDRLLQLDAIIQAATGMELRELLGAVAPGQAAFALYPGLPPFPVLITRVAQPAKVQRIYQRLGAAAPAHELRDGILTLTDTPANLRRVLRFRGSGQASLLGNAEYRARRVGLPPGAGLRFYLDLAAVRFVTRLGRVWDRAPDPARVLFGPLITAFDRSERIDGILAIDADALSLRSNLDVGIGESPASELRARGGAPRSIPAEPAGTVATVSLDRDLGVLLRQPERWLREDGQLGVASFLSILDLLLGGASFMQDLVPAIEVPLHLFVTASTPDADAERPRIRLPAFTLVFGLDPAAARRVQGILERGLNMVASVSNPGRLREKQAPLTVRSGGRDGYRYRFVEFGEFDGPGDPPTEHGLSPTLLFTHGHGILASTIDGAVRMARALDSGHRVPLVGDLVAVHGAALASLIRDNLEVLSMGRVLDEGESTSQAREFTRALAAIAEVLELTATLRSGAAQTGFELTLRRLRR